MKVLWLTFTVFPEAINLYGGKRDHKGSGGWLFSASNALQNNSNEIELRVAMISRNFASYSEAKGKSIYYYMIPFGKGIDAYHHGYDNFWMKINKEFHPDVVHVHGVESSIGLSYIRACGNTNVVCSIQGIPDIIARYLMCGIKNVDVIKNITIRDMVRCNTYFSLVKSNVNKEKLTFAYFQECKYFIGRTDWDKAHLWAINPDARYFFCNETLRPVFYNTKWSFDKSTPHTVFISAMKGIHLFLKALSLIVREYPDIQVRVATGGNLVNKGLKSKFMMTGFEKIIKKSIKEKGLSQCVTFLGPLSEKQMLNEYLSANVFVCPSTCENSSNAVCEAQMLGVPLVASYVGGMNNLIPNKQCGRLYRCEEYEMLAWHVCNLFETSSTFDNTEMRELARRRHDPVINAKRTIDIYKDIIQESMI